MAQLKTAAWADPISIMALCEAFLSQVPSRSARTADLNIRVQRYHIRTTGNISSKLLLSALPCPVLCCPVLFSDVLFYSALIFPALSCPVLSCVVLRCAVLFCLFLSCRVMCCPVMCCLGNWLTDVLPRYDHSRLTERCFQAAS